MKQLARRLAKRTLPQGLLRVFSNAREKYFYDRNLYTQTLAAIHQRCTKYAVCDDAAFMKALHDIFPTHGGRSLPLAARLDVARARLYQAVDRGVCLAGAEVLDIGAGGGEILQVGPEFGVREISGIDYSAERFRSDSRALGLTEARDYAFVEGDVHTTMIGENRFDVVVSFNSFEHFVDPSRVLTNCHRMLKPNGVAYISFDPLFASPYGAHLYSVTGIPYFQNLFSKKVVFDFLYLELRANDGLNVYTSQPIDASDPFPEMNKWTVRQFDDLFRRDPKWRILHCERRWSFEFYWFARLFRKELAPFRDEDLFVSSLTVILEKQ